MATPLVEEPLRLLHVSPSFYPAIEYGGPVASLYELCLAQRRAGLLVRVLTSTAGLATATAPRYRTLSGWIDDFGVPTYYAPVRLPPDLAPAMVPELVTLCRWAQVVHITGLFSAASVLALGTALAVNLGRSPARPVVLSPRGALLPWALAQSRGRARKQRFLTALAPLLRRVHGWHVTSDEEARSVRKVLCGLGAPQANIQIVVPGVVGGAGGLATNAGSDAQADLAPGSGSQSGPSFQLLVLGRIHPVKNIELALDALALLRRDVPQASLVIAGPAADDRYVDDLRCRAAALGLGAAVQWPGLVTGAAKQRLLTDCAALWLCSHMESFGNVVVEALAAGTPVVATHTTPWQLLDQAAVGRWVPPNPESLAAATRELLAAQHDLTHRQELATRCQQLAQSQFSWQHAEQLMRQLYFAARARTTRA